MHARAVTRPFPEFDVGEVPPEAAQIATRRTTSRRRNRSIPSFRQMSIFEYRQRDRRHACRYRYVRRPTGSHLYQARVYLPVDKGGSINLGLYETESAAHQVVTAWIRAGADPTKGLPAGVLPKYVKAVEGGFTWGVVLGGKRLGGELFATVEGAFHAALQAVNAARGMS